MKWLNIDIASLRSPDFIGADPTARATWLCLLGYCVDQENSGIIEDCESWGDRRWMQTCAVTRTEIDASKPLVNWNATALHVAFYPIEQESKTIANRNNGLKGGRPKQKSEIEPTIEPQENHMVNHMVQSGVNVKEGKGKESKEKKSNTLLTEVNIELESQFITFWNLYPRKDGKKQAFEKFKKAIKNHGFQKIMDGLIVYLPLAEVSGMLYTKQPASWLHAERFLDDPVSVQKQVDEKKKAIEIQKPKEKPTWEQCKRRCDRWDDENKWCKKREKQEPKDVTHCYWFNN